MTLPECMALKEIFAMTIFSVKVMLHCIFGKSGQILHCVLVMHGKKTLLKTALFVCLSLLAEGRYFP